MLGASADKGFRNAAWLVRDDDLASLHRDPRWKTVVARVKANATRDRK